MLNFFFQNLRQKTDGKSLKTAFFWSRVEKTFEKLHKFRKICNHKQNIIGIYNEKLHNNCLQQLPVLSLKIKFNSYLVQNSKKPTLNFHFKSRFSVKPSKFQIYFAKDWRPHFFQRFIGFLVRNYSKINRKYPKSRVIFSCHLGSIEKNVCLWIQ